MLVTYGLIGSEPASASIMPPTMEASAKSTESSSVRSGEAVTCIAAAAGVISRASTSSEPTTCTDSATAIPSTTMKTSERKRIGTPFARATSGSREAKLRGLHTIISRAIMTTAPIIMVFSWSASTDTI